MMRKGSCEALARPRAEPCYVPRIATSPPFRLLSVAYAAGDKNKER